ncbi:biotin/lipoyl-binding protein [Bradyrhizobium sp. 2TAF36]|uniref:biotin/lipoyl-binding protein n=1 Tax=unclassified Bradyrhizobium TaxID=2631580 RepID=UPI0014321B1C|nr:biotin/lipoyl-binding protein [Bradyrhizobium sp. MOS001]
MVTVEAGERGHRLIGRLVLPIAAVLLAVALVCVAGVRWNDWVGGTSTQVTDDVHVRAHITRLSVRIAGQVRTVAVDHFESVRAGGLLAQIDNSEFAAIVAQAEANVAAARAALENLTKQTELQYAAIAQAEAAEQAAVARQVETREENVLAYIDSYWLAFAAAAVGLLLLAAITEPPAGPLPPCRHPNNGTGRPQERAAGRPWWRQVSIISEVTSTFMALVVDSRRLGLQIKPARRRIGGTMKHGYSSRIEPDPLHDPDTWKWIDGPLKPPEEV